MSWFLVEGDGWMIAIGLETEWMVSVLLGEKEGGRIPIEQKNAPCSSFSKTAGQSFSSGFADNL